MHMTGVDLKPCPFCGGKAIIKPNRDGTGGYVGCGNLDGCLMPHRLYDTKDGPHKAITAWNTRADLSKAAVEALEAKLAKAVEAVWEEYLDSERNKWTFRKEHVENAIYRTFAEPTGGKDE